MSEFKKGDRVENKEIGKGTVVSRKMGLANILVRVLFDNKHYNEPFVFDEHGVMFGFENHQEEMNIRPLHEKVFSEREIGADD